MKPLYKVVEYSMGRVLRTVMETLNMDEAVEQAQLFNLHRPLAVASEFGIVTECCGNA